MHPVLASHFLAGSILTLALPVGLLLIFGFTSAHDKVPGRPTHAARIPSPLRPGRNQRMAGNQR